MFGTTTLVEDGLDCDNQLPTPVETSNGSCRESRSQSIGADAMSIDADPAFSERDLLLSSIFTANGASLRPFGL